jgi:hypothetical protein
MTREELQLEAEQMAVISDMVRQTADTPQALLARLQQTHPHLIEDDIVDLFALFQEGLNK